MTTPPWCMEKVMVYYYYYFELLLFRTIHIILKEKYVIINPKSKLNKKLVYNQKYLREHPGRLV